MAATLLAVHTTGRGDVAVGSGWQSHAQRLLRDQPEGAEHGYPAYFEVFAAIARGDLDGALAAARRMQESGRRFADPNLTRPCPGGDRTGRRWPR
jgi:hypothetical protein